MDLKNKRWVTAAATFGAATVVFGAAALAQSTPTPTPSATATAGTTVTASTTAIAGGTGTSVVTGTVVATGTVVNIPTIAVPPSVYQAGGGPFPFANPAFERVWSRTDAPVKQGKVSRTFFWGPGPNTPGLIEQYNEDPSGRKQRLVQYFDKSRMELNNPNANSQQPFFVTNGLLTVELISGFIQVGEKDFNQYHPACIPMSGDFGDTQAPTYFAFQKVSNTQAGDHPSADRTGQRALETITRDGLTGTDPGKANVAGINFVHFESQTKHNIPSVFWDFLNSSGPVNNANGQQGNEQLITPWYFASGLPISEPYWAKAKIRGTTTDVLIQAFERRALTYVPTNSKAFQVEMANIGQHYFDWRYRNFGYCAATAPTTPTAPVPAATGTTTPAGTTTAVGTTTPVPSGTVSASPSATGTVQATVTATATQSVVPIGSPPIGTPLP